MTTSDELEDGSKDYVVLDPLICKLYDYPVYYSSNLGFRLLCQVVCT